MELESVSAPIVGLAVVPAPVPTVDMPVLFIHLFLVIDPCPVRLSLIGRIVCVHSGGRPYRGRGRGIDRTPSDRRQYAQTLR
jgi:hypothetical protein